MNNMDNTPQMDRKVQESAQPVSEMSEPKFYFEQNSKNRKQYHHYCPNIDTNKLQKVLM